MPDSRSPLANGLIALLVVAGLAAGPAAVAAQDASIEVTTTDGQVVVPPTAEATVSGTADLAAGENLTVRAQSTGDTQPQFLKTRTVSVDEDGSFAAAFDFSSQSAGDAFEVTVRHDGETVADADGVVRDAESTSAERTTEVTTTVDGVSGVSTPGFGVASALVAIGAIGALLAVGADGRYR